MSPDMPDGLYPDIDPPPQCWRWPTCDVWDDDSCTWPNCSEEPVDVQTPVP